MTFSGLQCVSHRVSQWLLAQHLKIAKENGATSLAPMPPKRPQHSTRGSIHFCGSACLDRCLPPPPHPHPHPSRCNPWRRGVPHDALGPGRVAGAGRLAVGPPHRWPQPGLCGRGWGGGGVGGAGDSTGCRGGDCFFCFICTCLVVSMCGVAFVFLMSFAVCTTAAVLSELCCI